MKTPNLFRMAGAFTVAVACVFAGAVHAQLPTYTQAQQRRRSPVVDVFEAVKPSVVNISTTQIISVRSPMGLEGFFDDFFDMPRRNRVREYRSTSVGSGFVLHPAGYIVTNAHVVARTAERKVIFADGREFDAQVVAMDTKHDLAVLKIENDEPLIPINLGTSDDLMIGETVIAIGNPFGYQTTVTAGVVSALNRTIDAGNDVTFTDLIQTDASINPGNSGGPLLNILGELVGINTAIRADAENIGFAIPVDHLRNLLPDMLDIERRYRIVTGFHVTPIGPPIVDEVRDDSPAMGAGLQVGDRIVGVDGEPVDNSIDYLVSLIDKKPGDHVALRVQREGVMKEIDLTLAERPRPDGKSLLWSRLGIDAQPVDDLVARSMGIRGLTGLLVNDVEPDSPAARIQMQRGDVIVQLGRHQILGFDDTGELLEQVRTDQALEISVLRISGRVIFRSSAAIRAR